MMEAILELVAFALQKLDDWSRPREVYWPCSLLCGLAAGVIAALAGDTTYRVLLPMAVERLTKWFPGLSDHLPAPGSPSLFHNGALALVLLAGISGMCIAAAASFQDRRNIGLLRYPLGAIVVGAVTYSAQRWSAGPAPFFDAWHDTQYFALGAAAGVTLMFVRFARLRGIADGVMFGVLAAIAGGACQYLVATYISFADPALVVLAALVVCSTTGVFITVAYAFAFRFCPPKAKRLIVLPHEAGR